MTTKAIEAGARAVIAARKKWEGREGPFGVYDLGYPENKIAQPNAVRDFRPQSKGAVARFDTHEEAMAQCEFLTEQHYAAACIEAAIASGELVPANAVAAERERCIRELQTSYPGHAWLNAACAAIRALEPASGEFVLAPREPTEAMLDAYWHQAGESKEMRLRTHSSARRYYTAMLTAATSNGSGK